MQVEYNSNICSYTKCENEWVIIGFIIPSIYLLAWWHVVLTGNTARRHSVIGYGRDLMILDDYEGSIEID
jgi:hypothetical protein